jgi:hypothetical protein
MRIGTRVRIGAASVFALAATAAMIGPATTSFAAGSATIAQQTGYPDQGSGQTNRGGPADNSLHLQLTPSSPQLGQCMPNADVRVDVRLTTDQKGFDTFDITANHIAPNRDYTVFLLEQAATPFGAAEYIGDLSTNDDGNGQAEFNLIVQEAFSSTLVNGQRVRVDLNRVGMWFADPKDDDFCLGPNSPITPFDGDNEAGVQAFNSANSDPLPAP